MALHSEFTSKLVNSSFRFYYIILLVFCTFNNGVKITIGAVMNVTTNTNDFIQRIYYILSYYTYLISLQHHEMSTLK